MTSRLGPAPHGRRNARSRSPVLEVRPLRQRRATLVARRRLVTRHLAGPVLAILAASSMAAAQEEPRAAQEVRRVLEDLPQHGVFDWITFTYDRGEVTLAGFARDPSLKGA